MTEASPAPGRSPAMLGALGAVLAIAALVRLAAAWNDLWLDEIWTIILVGNLRSPLGVFTLHHDNNHVLNTLWAYAVRSFDSDLVYRLPAWAGGVATVVLGARLAGMDDDDPRADDAPAGVRALVAAVLLGAAYLLVYYASEARGYSLCLAFGLAALGIVHRHGLDPRSRRAPLAWAALVLAMLGHALAIHLLLALVAWSAVRVARRRDSAEMAVALAWWYAVPLAAYAIFYLGFLRALTIGGGPREGALAPLAGAIAATAGLPAATPPALLLGIGTAVLGLGIGWLAARRSDLWVLYLVGIVVSPAVLAVLHPTDLYAERYFILSATLWLLLAARLVAWLTRRGRAAAICAAVTLTAFLAGNAVHIATLVRNGRGAFRAPMAYMARETPGNVVTITSDHDFRIRMVVDYYASRVGSTKRFSYVDSSALTAPGPEWYVIHDPPPGPAPRTTRDLRGNRYRRAIAFPAAPFQGMPWNLYRRVD